MSTSQHLGSASLAAMVAAFPRGPRIAFAPDGDGRSQEQVKAAMAKEGDKKDAAKPDAAKKDAAPKTDGAKKDEGEAAGTDKLDRLLSLMDSIGSRLDATNARMDAMEEKSKADAAKADASKKDEMSQPSKEEREASERQSGEENGQEKERDKAGVGDAAKKDEADDKDKDEKRDDKAKADAVDLSRYERDMADIRSRQAASEARLPRVLTDAEEQAFAATQAKADSAYALHGKRAPAPLMGETLMAYRLRLTREHQKFSPTLKGADLNRIAAADPGTYDVLEATIYADSAVAANNPMDIERGELRMRTTRDITGRNAHTFHGPDTFVKGMRPPVMKYVKTFNTAAGRA